MGISYSCPSITQFTLHWQVSQRLFMFSSYILVSSFVGGENQNLQYEFRVFPPSDPAGRVNVDCGQTKPQNKNNPVREEQLFQPSRNNPAIGSLDSFSPLVISRKQIFSMGRPSTCGSRPSYYKISLSDGSLREKISLRPKFCVEKVSWYISYASANSSNYQG